MFHPNSGRDLLNSPFVFDSTRSRMPDWMNVISEFCAVDDPHLNSFGVAAAQVNFDQLTSKVPSDVS